MTLLPKAFRLLVMLLVALPMGPGGLCCCLVGSTPAGASAEIAVAEHPASPCCAMMEEGAPAPDSPGAPDPALHPGHPATEDEAPCECPVRDTAFVPSNVPGATIPLPGPAVGSIVWDGEVVLPAGAPPEPRAPAIPHPPPKIPIYRSLSILLS